MGATAEFDGQIMPFGVGGVCVKASDRCAGQKLVRSSQKLVRSSQKLVCASQKLVWASQKLVCASQNLVCASQKLVCASQIVPANRACTSAPTEMTRTGSGYRSPNTARNEHICWAAAKGTTSEKTGNA